MHHRIIPKLKVLIGNIGDIGAGQREALLELRVKLEESLAIGVDLLGKEIVRLLKFIGNNLIRLLDG